MELGNLFFGNSRGKYEVPREFVNLPEWITLMYEKVQVQDYHCRVSEFKEDGQERTCSIPPTECGGFKLKINGEVIFELFPYYWGDCTCGAEEKNEEIEEKLFNELLTKEERQIYTSVPDCCDNGCPADDLFDFFNLNELRKIKSKCTCGQVQKNIEILEAQEKIRSKTDAYEKRLSEELIGHSDNCLLVKNNFIYHPGKEDELRIQWYKYPFRDAYMNRDICKEEFQDIILDCINSFPE